MAKNYLSVTEAAAERGVTRGRIHELIREGRLKPERVGNQYVIRRSVLDKLKLGKPGRPRKS